MKISLFLLAIITSYSFFNCKNATSPNSLENKNSITIKTDKATLIEDSEKQNISTTDIDIQNIFQKAIDLPKLQQYYHIDKHPDRSPLILAVHDTISKNISLHKFGKPVLIINKTNTEEQYKSQLSCTKFNLAKNAASIDFKYSVEGIKVKIEFIKSNDLWVVKESLLLEN